MHIVVCRKEGAVRALTKRELGEVELMLDVVWAGVLASDAIEHGGIPLNPVPARPDVVMTGEQLRPLATNTGFAGPD